MLLKSLQEPSEEEEEEEDPDADVEEGTEDEENVEDDDDAGDEEADDDDSESDDEASIEAIEEVEDAEISDDESPEGHLEPRLLENDDAAVEEEGDGEEGEADDIAKEVAGFGNRGLPPPVPYPNIPPPNGFWFWPPGSTPFQPKANTIGKEDEQEDPDQPARNLLVSEMTITFKNNLFHLCDNSNCSGSFYADA